MDKATEVLEDGLMKIEDAQQFVGISRSGLYRAMDKNELDYVMIGRARRIPRRSLIRWASKNAVLAHT